MIQSTAFLRLLQVGFWAALLFTLFSAFAPSSQVENLLPWDKAQHFLAFYVLSVLGAAAFPKRSLIVIGSVLSGLGALIELVQATPFVARDGDVFDWVADTVAIVVALGPVVLMHWRARMQRE
jgi:VanZ family protein